MIANRCLTIALLVISFISVACAKHSAIDPVNSGEPPTDTPYYAGGNSRVGIAGCTTADFLAWVNK